MKIQPVSEYDPPTHSSFVMKNGRHLAAGLASLAMVGMLAGCGNAGMESLGGEPTQQPTPTETIEVLDGDISTTPDPSFEILDGAVAPPLDTPVSTEMILGELVEFETE